MACPGAARSLCLRRGGPRRGGLRQSRLRRGGLRRVGLRRAGLRRGCPRRVRLRRAGLRQGRLRRGRPRRGRPRRVGLPGPAGRKRPLPSAANPPHPSRGRLPARRRTSCQPAAPAAPAQRAARRGAPDARRPGRDRPGMGAAVARGRHRRWPGARVQALGRDRRRPGARARTLGRDRRLTGVGRRRGPEGLVVPSGSLGPVREPPVGLPAAWSWPSAPASPWNSKRSRRMGRRLVAAHRLPRLPLYPDPPRHPEPHGRPPAPGHAQPAGRLASQAPVPDRPHRPMPPRGQPARQRGSPLPGPDRPHPLLPVHR
jgi:hypothetical protein